MVEHAPRCPHQDLRALFQALDLAQHRRAAVDGKHRDARVLAQRFELARDLQRQLARGAQHQRLHGLHLAAHQPIDERQPEGRRLARPRARLNYPIFATRGGLEYCALHRRGVHVAQIGHRALHLRAERQHFKCGVFFLRGFGFGCYGHGRGRSRASGASAPMGLRLRAMLPRGYSVCPDGGLKVMSSFLTSWRRLAKSTAAYLTACSSAYRKRSMARRCRMASELGAQTRLPWTG